MLDGKKWTSTRGGWSIREEQAFRKCLDNGTVLRLQGNWACDTICGWGKLAFISPKGEPHVILTRDALIEAGCGDMTSVQYIQAYCTDPQTQLPFKEVFTISFAAVWTKEGVRVTRNMD